MGLDIYVGPLSRYYSGQWLTILQQVGIAQGMPVQVIRSQQPRSFWSRITSRFVGRQPAHRIDAIVAWRDDLASRGLFHPAIEWEWPESLDIAYETDKPSVTGWGAVQLWAAYAEQPHLERPSELPADWDQNPVLLRATHYDQIYRPELWLPVEFDQIFEAAEVNGNICKIGSTFALDRQLKQLNEATWNATGEIVSTWSFEAGDDFESDAKLGFEIWNRLAKKAAAERLPMRLDY